MPTCIAIHVQTQLCTCAHAHTSCTLAHAPAGLLTQPCLQRPSFRRAGPADPPLQGLAYATLAAGELEALLCGARGVVMLQLAVGWDAGAPQPISNPLVLAGLRRALGNKGVSVFMSPAPGEAALRRALHR